MDIKKVTIIGAGPAGLTAGLTLAQNGINVEIFEAESKVGGISKTINHNGFYFDLGGHRFFSKYDEVNKLWSDTLKDALLKRPRQSRIFYKNKFFDYPLKPINALLNMGINDTILVLMSYIKAKIFPYKTEETFEEWVTNRFGKKLYTMFFKTYTEKVWGTDCSKIGADWAAQRIKGLSLYSAIYNAFFKPKGDNIKTLIDEFLYPKFGPGMMYEKMEEDIIKLGGKIHKNARVSGIEREEYKIKGIKYISNDIKENYAEADYLISSMPLTELVKIMNPVFNDKIINSASTLTYRSLINVDIILNKECSFPDNWIYIHSPEVKLGRIQNFKRWSPYMVADSNKSTLGLEYFCTENDDFWNLSDDNLINSALDEVEKIGLAERENVEDAFVVRVPKAYPVYSPGYLKHIEIIRSELDKITNLQPIGRYGIFRYNNMDHSIMTGLYAARNILYNEKNDIWSINNEPEYHEIKDEKSKSFNIPAIEKG